MATITPQTVSGGALTYAAASAGGDTVAFGSSTRPVILVRNASGSSVTVTLAGVNPCSQGFTHSVAYTCAVGDTEIDPPANTVAANGNVALTYSASASVTVAGVTS
jgi:hypothetical protein